MSGPAAIDDIGHHARKSGRTPSCSNNREDLHGLGGQTSDPEAQKKATIGRAKLGAAAGPILFYCALKISDISVVKPIAFTVAPATAALIGWTLLGEPVTPKKVIAVALILGGVVLLTTK